MKKIFSVFLLVAAMAQFAQAQTITVSGTVQNKSGDFLHYAFIQDKAYKYATYSDSVGNFVLNANPASKLIFSCYGYNDTTVDIDNKTTFNIVLSLKPAEAIVTSNAAKDGTDVSNHAVLQDAFSPNTNNASGPNYNLASGASFPEFHHKDATEGSRYLFMQWVHGYVINSADSLIQNPGFYFNYDKINGGLLLSQDKSSAIEVDRTPIKSFTLYDDHNIPYTFENAPSIDPKHYAQVLASGKKYKIYKLIATKFQKADYTTNGIASTGNNFDSYQDSYTYYVLNVQTNALEKLQLKKKSIKTDFASDADKVNKFMDDHSSDSIDDTYLSTLGSYMNE